MPRKAAAANSAPAPSGPRDLPVDYFDDAWVEIFPPHGLGSDYARALLAAAERLGYDPSRAVHSISGGFRVPNDVADATTFPDEPTPTGRHTLTPLAAIERGAIVTEADENAGADDTDAAT